MAHYSDEGCDGMELLDLLFDQTDGILRHEELGRHGNQLWPITAHGTPRPTGGSDELLDVLLRGGDCVSESSLWPPSPSDSGISEDPHSDQMDSPPPSDRLPLEPQSLSVPQHTSPSLVAAEPDFSIDLDGWQSGAFRDGTRAVRFAADVHRTRKSPGTPLTVKDLLLSGTVDLVPQPFQEPFQELILNEDEKKLLAKEGVTLPSQLPLTKFEERILKKVRRKIRNKQSAQESRKKKKEYIDGLESRMAACSAQNQELQRKVFQLEKRHTSLMEQLRKLQALVMSGSTKTAQTGTCLLVLVLSFSLILFPSLKPFSDSSVSQEGDFTPVRVQSRSLHNIQSSRVLRVLNHPYSGREESKSVSPFSGNEGVEEITSLLKKLQGGHGFSHLEAIAHNNSLEERGHHHGDPITGHVTTVTLSPRYGTPLSPHGDDM